MVNITINTDKTISINGKKTFLIGMGAICYDMYSIVNCEESVAINNKSIIDFTPTASSFSISTKDVYYGDRLFVGRGWEGINNTEVALNGFFGWSQWDEPNPGVGFYKNYTTKAQVIAHLASVYAERKYAITGHPVSIVLCCDYYIDVNLWAAQNYADIVMWDYYAYQDDLEIYGDLVDYNYWWEIASVQNVGITTDLENFNKPVMTYIQALGVTGTGVYPITKKMARAATYTAITAGVDGIQYYAYLYEGAWNNDPNTTTGLWKNQTLAAEYNEIIKEVKSINDVLVSPTVSHSWHSDFTSDDVTFSNTIYKTIAWYPAIRNWNYIRKEVNGKTYLIVVNKDVSPVSNVQMTVSGLSGTMGAKMLGDETTGSASEHKSTPIPVTNGVFTDNFDGYAVHIYQISSDIPCPASECDFTITQ